MSNIGCSIKRLPPELWNESANTAVGINPANAPAVHALQAAMPGAVIPVAHLSLLTAKYWGAKGVKLTVGFLDNPAADLRARIVSHMNAWGAWCNAQFVETAGTAQVRIARQTGADTGGYWSYLGTDILHIAAGQPTMNLEAFTMSTAESEFHRVVRHETGHTLGFPHEHMRPEIVNRIDPAKAIAHFAATDGWTPAEVTAQVLTPLSTSALVATAQADIHSIMCYWLPASIMKDGVEVTGGTDIDSLDAQFAASVYPGPVSPNCIWPNGKAYFFKGAQYTRYDPVADKADAGYPLPIAGNWGGFPAPFAAGVDAAVKWTNGKAYFFKGNQYIRYDIVADKMDAGYPLAIAGHWGNFPPVFAAGVDAGLVWPNGKAYFFKGSQYIRYDIAADKMDPGYPKAISAGWPGFPAAFAAGVDAAVVWNNGKAYFFKGNQYIRYDVAADKTDAGYPQPIQGHWAGLFPNGVDA